MTGLELEPIENNEAEELEGANELPEGLTASFVVRQAQAWEKDWEEFISGELSRYRYYQKLSRSQNTDQRSVEATVVPLAENITSTITSRIYRASFPSGKVVDAVLDEEIPANGDYATAVNKVEEFVNQKVSESPDTKPQAEDFFNNSTILGTAYGQVYWERQPFISNKTEVIEDPETGEAVVVAGKPKKGTRGVARWCSISPYDFAFAPNHGNEPIMDVEWCRIEHDYSIAKMVSLENDGTFENVSEIIRKYTSGISSGQDEKRVAISALNDPTSPEPNRNIFKVREYWATVTYKVDGEIKTHEARFFIADNGFLVRYKENPYKNKKKPFVAFRHKVRAGQFLGSSALEPVASLIERINTNKGKEGDLIKRSANTPLLAGAASGITTRNLFMDTNGVIAVPGNVNDIKELSVNPAAIQYTQRSILSDIALVRDSTPANDQAQGIGGNEDTATEARINQLASSVKFEHLASRSGVEFVSPLHQWFFWLYQQFGRDGEMFYREGSRDGRPVSVSKAELQREFRFVHQTTDSEGDKNIRMLQLDKAIDRILQIATATGNMQLLGGALKILRDNALPMLGIGNSKELIPEQIEQPAPQSGAI